MGFLSRIFLHQRGNQPNTDGMDKLPPNMTPFAPFHGLPPLHRIDQTVTRKLGELAHPRDCTVKELIHEALGRWVAECETERELEAKIIRFPKQLRRTGCRFEFVSRRDEK
jgi:hypothetical protein